MASSITMLKATCLARLPRSRWGRRRIDQPYRRPLSLSSSIVLLVLCGVLALACRSQVEPEVPEFVPAVRAPAKKVTLEELAALSQPHVVRIESDAGVGSGFFVDNDLIVTCLHAVQGSEDVRATTRDYVGYVGEAIGVLALSREEDLAILRVSPPRYRSGLVLAGKAPSQRSHVGIVSLSPLTAKATVADGIVSKYRTESDHLFQFSPAIPRGSSGGPILNDVGEVVGVVVADPNDLNGARPAEQRLNTAVSTWVINEMIQRSSPMEMPEFARLTESEEDAFWRPIRANLPEIARRLELSLGVTVGDDYARRFAEAVTRRNKGEYGKLVASQHEAAKERKNTLDLAEALRGMPPDGPDLAKELIDSWEKAATRETQASKQRLVDLTEEAVGYSRTYLDAGAVPAFPEKLGGLQFLSSVKKVDSSCSILNPKQGAGDVDEIILVRCPYLEVSPSFLRGPVFLTYLKDQLVGVRADGADYPQAVRILSERYGLADFGVWQKGNWDFSGNTTSYGPNTLYEWRMKGGRIRAGNQYGKTFVSYIHENFQRATDDIY